MVNQNEVIDYILATATHNSPDGTDWKQLFYQSQIIYGDKNFSTFVKKLEEFAIMASQAKYFINPEHSAQVEEYINSIVMKFIYAICGKSSENGGELINLLSTESKRIDYNMFGGEKGKPESMISKVKNYDYGGKVVQPMKAESQGMRQGFH